MIGMCCRVQFDRRELGVELVKDVDVMPIDPTDNLPSIFAPMMVGIPKSHLISAACCSAKNDSKFWLHGMPLCLPSKHVQRCQGIFAWQDLCCQPRHEQGDCVLQGSIILNGRRPLQEAPRVRKIARAFRVDNGLRGPAAGRAQQEARAAAAAAAAQQQLRSEADVRALMEVWLPPVSSLDKLS